MKAINRNDFGLLQHKVRQFAVTVPAGTTVKEIENPKLWVNVAQNQGIEIGSDVRVQLEDMSALHFGIVTYCKGTDVKVKVYQSFTLDKVSGEAEPEGDEPYFTKFRGPRKWSIVNRSDASIFQEDIDTEEEAKKLLDELLDTLSR